ncbi:MAG: NAD(+) synthase [Akkermansiaceae bacterium]|nr:NAD(+) synthase [Armatimonadota bacterium]
MSTEPVLSPIAQNFFSPFTHGFVRVAVAVPDVKVADPVFNAERTLALARRAADDHAQVCLFPELGISSYTCDDLFHQDALLDAVRTALDSLRDASSDISCVLVVGAPLRFENRVYNCAVVLHRGAILGVVPKSYLPNYREFYEKRYFASARDAGMGEVSLLGATVPFGTDLVFTADDIPGFALHAEICEDVWTPVPPSTFAALNGATVLCNLSASNITIGKAEWRKTLCAGHSGRCVAAYLYSAAGAGESTTDLAWDGHALIYENGDLLAESERFADGERLIVSDIDLERLTNERTRLSSFTDSAHDFGDRKVRRISIHLDLPEATDIPLRRRVERFPFVPTNAAVRDERCYEAYNIQVAGLTKRLQSSRIQKIVIGVSGGLDSTHALIVAAKTMDKLGLPRENILAYTMPGFATTEKTKTNAHDLMNALGVTAKEIDIRPSCLQMLKDLDHPFHGGEPVYDITFENVQAGERTSHLFRLANFNNGLVLGTGDLSELALGWCTYGVGDHMSHYNVNASVPKTLIQYLIRWVIGTNQFGDAASGTLLSIVETEISPELVPHGETETNKTEPAQSTEAKIGPYPLQDFHLYYTTRFGFRPSKVAFLCWTAWHDAHDGGFPDGYPEAKRVSYDLPTVKRWLREFLWRFFQTSQFKRSCVPNSPKVGSGGSLSPRGDWRAPSDGESAPWIAELVASVPDGDG